MDYYQPGILQPLPEQAVYLTCNLRQAANLQQDNLIGRRRSDNLELDDAPESAHVKRTAQESFDLEAFLVRRSMRWSIKLQAG